jgi:DnaJ-class molecular chaperone
MDPKKLLEIAKIAQQIDKLDYYQILNVQRNANTQGIKEAFYKRSRQFHPDRYFNVGNEDFRQDVNKIYKRISEAYAILRNDRDRESYTLLIGGPKREENLRYMKKVEDTRGQSEEYDGGNGPGKRYYLMAAKAFKNLDYNSAKINLQLALSMEDDNENFQSLMTQIDEIIAQRGNRVQLNKNTHEIK